MVKMNDQGGQNIQIDLGALDPVYANQVLIGHTAFDFTINFIQMSVPTGKLVAKVIMSPQHAKAFAEALEENISKYETSFGKVNFSSAMKKAETPKVGFKKEESSE